MNIRRIAPGCVFLNQSTPAMSAPKHNRNSANPIRSLFIALLVAMTVTACGGGGGSGGGSVSSSGSGTPASDISGIAMAGPIANGTVTAYAVTSSGTKGASLGATTTDANGAYSLSLSYTGPVFLEVTGGSYVDEATGQTVNVPTTLGSGLQAVMSNVTTGSTAQITPLTTMAVARAMAMSGGLTIANISAANQQVGSFYGGIDILNTRPINPLIVSTFQPSQNAIIYGMILAGLSEEANTLGLSNPLDLVTALALDYSDGNFNGEAGSASVQLGGSAMDAATGTTELGAAISIFSTDTTHNIEGATVPSTIIASIGNNTVPSLAGLTQSTAQVVITGTGLTVGTVTYAASATVSFGDVISQSLIAGSHATPGAVINLTISGAGSILYSFGDHIHGYNPRGGVIQGLDGNLYGTTFISGPGNAGTVFKLTLAGEQTILHAFADSSTDGKTPGGRIVQGADGNFYGVTWDGGTYNQGIVYKVTSDGVETILHSFGDSATDGNLPYAGLIQGADGNFYGTTSGGGIYGAGTVFKVTPEGVETVLHSFGDSFIDGTVPAAGASGVIQATDGNFYGTTWSGGLYDLGTVFKITPAGVETVFYSFGEGANDGANPFAGLIQGTDGNFYGVTSGFGTVFKITPDGVGTILHAFSIYNHDGNSPNGVIQGADGNFYGTTLFGGGDYMNGIVFKLTPDGVETILHIFDSQDPLGTSPSSLMQGEDGNFYGTCLSGGANGGGTVFKFAP